MSSNGDDTADVGLLSPVSAGTAAESLTSDRAVAHAMVAFERALAEVLDREAPASTELDIRALALDAVRPGNPTVPLLAATRSAAAHAGATSQDVVDSALMIVATSVLQQGETDLVVLADRLAALTREHRERPCAARTLSQQAMPTTLGFRTAGWLAGVLDALELVRECRPLPVSLGGPVGTAADFGTEGPRVLAALAERLGLAAPVVSWHTRRVPLLRLGTALLAVGEACGRLCADVLLMAQTEVGEADDGSAGGSSAMAHKSNPTRSVLVASAAQQLPGLLATVASSAASGSERPPGAWHAEWQPLRTMLRLAGAAAERTADLAGDLTFDELALRRNLDLLVTATGQDDAWVSSATAHVGVWVDRVLARHAEATR